MAPGSPSTRAGSAACARPLKMSATARAPRTSRCKRGAPPVAAWRSTPYFSDAERAALALAESVTRLSDRMDPVSDEVWREATRHYDERALATLLLSIAVTNAYNRLNVATQQVAAGDWKA